MVYNTRSFITGPKIIRKLCGTAYGTVLLMGQRIMDVGFRNSRRFSWDGCNVAKSFVMSVRPSARVEQLGSHRMDFHENFIFEIFMKICREN